MNPITFFVHGVARPGGSKTASVVFRKGGAMVMRPNGSPLIAVRESGKHTKEWRNAVADVAASVVSGPPTDEPLAMYIVFVLQRPGSHFRTGKHAGQLKESAPLVPCVIPDATKLTRAVEDCLKGIVYRDDKQIARQFIEKEYGDQPGALIHFRRWEDSRSVRPMIDAYESSGLF